MCVSEGCSVGKVPIEARDPKIHGTNRDENRTFRKGLGKSDEVIRHLVRSRMGSLFIFFLSFHFCNSI